MDTKANFFLGFYYLGIMKNDKAKRYFEKAVTNEETTEPVDYAISCIALAKIMQKITADQIYLIQ